jgi:hypothetical protein
MNHPKLHGARIVGEGSQRRLQVTAGVDEREYKKWKEDLDSMRPSADYLLLPTSQDFKRKGLCGDSGTLTVTTISLS